MSVPVAGPDEPDRPAAASERLRTAAYVLAATAVGVPLVVVLLVRAVLFQLDPRGIVGEVGAYEVEYLAAGAVAGLVMVIAIARVLTLLGAVDRAAVRYPTLIVQLQLGLAIAAVAFALLTPTP